MNSLFNWNLRVLLTVTLLFNYSGFCYAADVVLAPGGVTQGSYAQSDVGPVTLQTVSDGTIANFTQFGISSGRSLDTTFTDGSGGKALFRVGAGAPASVFNGPWGSNGKIFLINPNGIIFGSGAQLNMAGLTASTLNLTDADFNTGRLGTNEYIFSGTGANGAAVVNQALLSPGGYVALIGSHVVNDTGAKIVANLGQIALAAGESVTLNLDAQGIVNVVINDTALFDTASNAGVENHGTLSAPGKSVILTAKTLNSVFDHAINNDGIIEATTIGVDHGKVVLFGDSSVAGDGDVAVGGRIRGGDVEITSNRGDVIHTSGNWTTTSGADFKGFAANNYIVQNNVLIDTYLGTADILAGQDIELGSPLALPTDTGAYVRSLGDVFLTAAAGRIHQGSGAVYANRLMLTANTGIDGYFGTNSALRVKANQISGVNFFTGNLLITNLGDTTVADLSSLVGLNATVAGFNGIQNFATGATTEIAVAPLLLDYRINGDTADWGVDLFATGADKIGYLDSHLPYGGNTIQIFHEDNNSIHQSGLRPVGPGNSDRNNADAEAAYLDHDSGFLYVTVISGVPLNGATFPPGDVALDIGGEGYQYAINVRDGHLYRVDPDTGWNHPTNHARTQPWRMITGTDLGQVDFAYGPNVNSHYVIQAKIPLEKLNLNTTSSSVKVQWTMSCGNDFATLPGLYNPLRSPTLTVNAPIIKGTTRIAPRLPLEDLARQRLYYQILSPSQLRSFEPMKPIGLFAYHPVTPTDRSAIDKLDLSTDAYDYIEKALGEKAR